MAEEWRPGLLAERLGRVRVEGEAKLGAALRELALTVERQAKANALQGGSHRYGQPTSASPGTGPAVVSGTLRRSIVTTRLRRSGFAGFELEVGMAGGVYPPKPPYPASARTPSSRYALYLETVWNYPFLGPAYRQSLGLAQGIWLKHFSTWPGIRG